MRLHKVQQPQNLLSLSCPPRLWESRILKPQMSLEKTFRAIRTFPDLWRVRFCFFCLSSWFVLRSQGETSEATDTLISAGFAFYPLLRFECLCSLGPSSLHLPLYGPVVELKAPSVIGKLSCFIATIYFKSQYFLFFFFFFEKTKESSSSTV